MVKYSRPKDDSDLLKGVFVHAHILVGRSHVGELRSAEGHFAYETIPTYGGFARGITFG